MHGKILSGTEQEQAAAWLALAVDVARASQCRRRKCGSVLIGRDATVLGRAENKLPGDCGAAVVHCDPYALSSTFKSDKACCIHAEQRTVMQALAQGHDLQGSILVFASVDDHGNALPSGQPYCTICSKMALEAGVAYWILEHDTSITQYEASVYNFLSFHYAGG